MWRTAFFLSAVLALAGCRPAPPTEPAATKPDDIASTKHRVETREASWILDEGLCEPETAVYDAGRDEMFVSNICGFERNGRGYISRVGMDGTLREERWVEGLNAPAGMAIAGGRLWIADIDRVHVIELESGEALEPIDLAGTAKALNDIAVAEDGTVFVSDFMAACVHRVRGETRDRLAADRPFPAANGLHLGDGRLFVGGERLWSVDLQTEQVTDFGPDELLDIDGIEGDGGDGLLASEVGGRVWHLPSSGPPTILEVQGMSSTNHLYVPDHRLVVVPTGYDGTLVAFTWP